MGSLDCGEMQIRVGSRETGEEGESRASAEGEGKKATAVGGAQEVEDERDAKGKKSRDSLGDAAARSHQERETLEAQATEQGTPGGSASHPTQRAG